MSGLRFLLVGVLGELIYLALFAIASRAGLGSLTAITLAGAICTVLNGFLHARISFRVRFHWTLLRDYLAVQLLCLGVALGAGALMDRVGAEPSVIAVATMVLWSGASFLLTRWRYRQAEQA
jgi:putative flippase GtrA